MGSAEEPQPPGAGWRPLLNGGGVVVLFIVVLRSAWLCDDAFISFRAAYNLAHGYGLVSNPGERVQGFTNPLWTLVLAALQALPLDIYWIAVGASLACTVGVALLLVWRREATWAPVLALVLLSASYGFTAFSTGGLENPLAHLLLAAFCLGRLRADGDRSRSWILAGLIGFNRLDHLLLVMPALLVELFQRFRGRGRRARGPWWRPALIGLSPLLAWLLFATVYYGFPFPNTAYAKLNLDIPLSELASQGMAYLVDAAMRDPVVPVTLLLAAVIGVCRRGTVPAAATLLAGIAVYVAYIVSVGGDFMSGRLLTAPYLLAVVVLSESVASLGRGPCAALLILALVHRADLLAPRSPDLRTECLLPPSGIVDERACYIEHTGVAQNVRVMKYRTHAYYIEGKRDRADTQVVARVVGMRGFAAGPRVHVIDEYGLTDPVVARIRFRRTGPNWRIGHFARPLPDGYLETLKTLENRIEDPCVRRLWEDLRLVTRGPVFELGRLGTLVRMNLETRVCP